MLRLDERGPNNDFIYTSDDFRNFKIIYFTLLYIYLFFIIHSNSVNFDIRSLRTVLIKNSCNSSLNPAT